MFYTEFLPRINSVTALVDFDHHQVSDITNISSSNQKLTVTTADQAYSVTLPITVNDPIRLTNLKIADQQCLSVSLAVNAKMDSQKAEPNSFLAQNSTKWSCKDLSQKTPVDDNNQRIFHFSCAKCDQELVSSKKYKFMDMPSEFWYEMMDFWHCHKPHNNHSTTKDYTGIIKPPNNHTVIIGSYYLLLDECKAVETIDNRVDCIHCGNAVGDIHEDSLRLNKWDLKLHYQNYSETFLPQLFIYNSILDKINSLATRKFKFHYQDKWWYLWIMNVGLDIAVEGLVLHKAMKILYFTDKNDDSNFVEEYESLSVTSPEIIQEFTKQLDDVNCLLPKCIKEVRLDRKWRVSYLAESAVA